MSNANTDVATLIRRTNQLLAVLAKVQLRSVLETELSDSKKKKLYELTDGLATVRDLAPKVGMSPAAISRAWQHWDDCGIVVKEDGRYKRVFE